MKITCSTIAIVPNSDGWWAYVHFGPWRHWSPCLHISLFTICVAPLLAGPGPSSNSNIRKYYSRCCLADKKLVWKGLPAGLLNLFSMLSSKFLDVRSSLWPWANWHFIPKVHELLAKKFYLTWKRISARNILHLEIVMEGEIWNKLPYKVWFCTKDEFPFLKVKKNIYKLISASRSHVLNWGLRKSTCRPAYPRNIGLIRSLISRAQLQISILIFTV